MTQEEIELKIEELHSQIKESGEATEKGLALIKEVRKYYRLFDEMQEVRKWGPGSATVDGKDLPF